ncbi:MAG: MerR family transcriptional regulator [Pseudomonadota bacterium]
MTNKSAEAFRTISEVAEWLGVQTHVLRFWESKFSQVKPVKRAGGRRYYRPADMLLLGGIRKLLHEDGMTIKGVQKILREEGMAHVADMSPPLDEVTAAQVDGDMVVGDATVETEMAPPAEAVPEAAEPEPAPTADAIEAEPDMERAADPDSDQDPQAAVPVATDIPTAPEGPPSDVDPVSATPDLFPDTLSAEPAQSQSIEPPPAEESDGVAGDENAGETGLPGFMRSRGANMAEETSQETPARDASAPGGSLPSFMSAPATEDTADRDEAAAKTEPDQASRRPTVVDVPDDPDPADLPASPSALSMAVDAKTLNDTQKADIAPLLEKLTALRDKMDSARNASR